MNLSIVEVGMIVQIRTWEDMASEFRTAPSESISCRFGFPREMEYLCGESAKVMGVSGERVSLKFFNVEESDARRWFYSSDMIEPLVLVPETKLQTWEEK